METIEEKVDVGSIGKRLLKGSLRVAFHPTGIRDFLKKVIKRDYKEWYIQKELMGNLADINKYIVYFGSLFILYDKLR